MEAVVAEAEVGVVAARLARPRPTSRRRGRRAASGTPWPSRRGTSARRTRSAARSSRPAARRRRRTPAPAKSTPILIGRDAAHQRRNGVAGGTPTPRRRSKRTKSRCCQPNHDDAVGSTTGKPDGHLAEPAERRRVDRPRAVGCPGQHAVPRAEVGEHPAVRCPARPNAGRAADRTAARSKDGSRDEACRLAASNRATKCSRAAAPRREVHARRRRRPAHTPPSAGRPLRRIARRSPPGAGQPGSGGEANARADARVVLVPAQSEPSAVFEQVADLGRAMPGTRPSSIHRPSTQRNEARPSNSPTHSRVGSTVDRSSDAARNVPSAGARIGNGVVP